MSNLSLPSPQDTGVLCARVNVNNALPIYAGPGWKCLGSECLITDILPEIDDATLIRSSADLVNWTQAKFPKAIVGVYFSSRDAESAENRKDYPFYSRACPLEQFTEFELLPSSFIDPGPRRIVDYRQLAARAKLIRFAVGHCISHNAKICYSDNWSHNASWAGFIDFQDTISYMRELRKALNAQGILLVVNLAMFQSLNGADAGALGIACDGVSFEDPIPRNWCNDAEGVQRIVRLKQLITAGKCKVIDLPENQLDSTGQIDKAKQQDECTFNAGEAMLLGNVYVAYLFYWDLPEWADWPTKYGKSKGDIKWLDGMRATRQFANGLLTVDFGKRTASWDK